MKLFLFLFISFSFLKAESLLTFEQVSNNKVSTYSYCITDYSFSNNSLNFTYLNNDYSIDLNNYTNLNIDYGYTFDTNSNSCYIDRDNLLQLTYEQYSFLMGMFGIVLSSIIGHAFLRMV